jgi:hypothetical protein
MLVIFASENQIGFQRTYDGQIANSTCEVGTSKIIDVVQDKTASGRFYVGTDSGDIIVFFARIQDKHNIGCDIIGKIVGEGEERYKLQVLNQFIVKYFNDGLFHIYNITNTRMNEGMEEFAKVNYVKHKPQYPTNAEESLSSFEIVETSSKQGNNLVVRIPGTSSQILVLEVLNPEIRAEGWAESLIQNQSFVFIFCILVVLGYQCLGKKKSSKSAAARSYSKLDREHETGTSTNKQLNELQNRLRGLDSTAERLDKLGKDYGHHEEGKPTRRAKYGNKIDFLE